MRPWSTVNQKIGPKFDVFAKFIVSYKKMLLTGTLLVLSILKPHALFMTLSLGQTFLNIFCNCVIDVLVGAAVYVHNFLGI